MDTQHNDEHLSQIAPDDASPESLVQRDKPPTRGLFLTLFILSVLVAISMVGLWQLYGITIKDIHSASAPDPRLQNLRAANIAARDRPDPSCSVPESCDKGDQKILRVSLNTVVSAMTQEWNQKTAPQLSLLAPFGPNAAASPSPAPRQPPGNGQIQFRP